MRVGLISDTHGLLRPEAVEALRGVDLILHAGDIGKPAVLEGLNACLDHRGEAFVPELGQRFKAGPSFRVFATQNPRAAGGGRKGLPRSLLGRFTKVVVSSLSDDDLLAIAAARFPTLAPRRWRAAWRRSWRGRGRHSGRAPPAT